MQRDLARTRPQRPRVVVINDDQTFLGLMQELLEEEGYKVFTQPEGDGAHALVRRERPTLVILDLRLEHPDAGWAVLQSLTLDPATAAIPVIVCSADVRFLKEKAAWMHAHGCFLIEKPFGLDDLLGIITTALAPSA